MSEPARRWDLEDGDFRLYDEGWPDSMQAALYWNRKRRKLRLAASTPQPQPLKVRHKMALKQFTLTNSDVVYVDRTAIQTAEQRDATTTNLFVELNRRLIVDDTLANVTTIMEEEDAIEIFTATVTVDGLVFDPSQVAIVEPRDATSAYIRMKNSRRHRVNVTALAAATALGFSA